MPGVQRISESSKTAYQLFEKVQLEDRAGSGERVSRVSSHSQRGWRGGEGLWPLKTGEDKQYSLKRNHSTKFNTNMIEPEDLSIFIETHYLIFYVHTHRWNEDLAEDHSLMTQFQIFEHICQDEITMSKPMRYNLSSSDSLSIQPDIHIHDTTMWIVVCTMHRIKTLWGNRKMKKTRLHRRDFLGYHE